MIQSRDNDYKKVRLVLILSSRLKLMAEGEAADLYRWFRHYLPYVSPACKASV